MSKRKRQEEEVHGYCPTSPSYSPTSPSYEPPVVEKGLVEKGVGVVEKGVVEEEEEEVEEERIQFPLCTDRLLHELNGEIIQKQKELEVIRMELALSESILDQTKARRTEILRRKIEEDECPYTGCNCFPY